MLNLIVMLFEYSKITFCIMHFLIVNIAIDNKGYSNCEIFLIIIKHFWGKVFMQKQSSYSSYL